MQTFMIEQQHFFESTELIHAHEIEKYKKLCIQWICELLAVHYNRYDEKIGFKTNKKMSKYMMP